MSKRAKHRSILERWVITGTLTLKTPANFSSGENDGAVDMPVLRDETDGMPFIPGTSIAGALRNYLREREIGYGGDSDNNDREKNLYSTLLFGAKRGEEEGRQSPLITFDAPGRPSGFELRDGVKIDGSTRTAAENCKFDFELLSEGSTFDLKFELIIGGQDDRQKLVTALVTALYGLEKEDIFLGMRKTRGFGRCFASRWSVKKYNMANPEEWLAWLACERKGYGVSDVSPLEASYILEAVNEKGITLLPDNRECASLHAEFFLDGSVMIRSGFGETGNEPDMVHLCTSDAKGKDVPVIPGTSWAGVLRHRAERIVMTLGGNDPDKAKIIDEIFGPSKIEEGDEPWASRLSVGESRINGGSLSLIQSRIKIDRFTGGVYGGALFEEKPVFGNKDSVVALDLMLKFFSDDKEDRDSQIGLILLLLKDLWTGNLPLGGESSIGRGRLKGRKAALRISGREWIFENNPDGGLSVIGNADELEQFVRAFTKRMAAND